MTVRGMIPPHRCGNRGVGPCGKELRRNKLIDLTTDDTDKEPNAYGWKVALSVVSVTSVVIKLFFRDS